MIGQKFGKLTIIERKGSDKYKASLWLCSCDCGNEKIIRLGHLKSGEIKSCGCLKKETSPENGKRGRGKVQKRLRGEKHPKWKENRCSTQAIHQWLNRNFPKKNTCSSCGNKGKTDYANLKNHGYKKDFTDYIELCRSCHWQLDNA